MWELRSIQAELCVRQDDEAACAGDYAKANVGNREHGVPKCRISIPGGFGAVL